ncbi:hypothetical protein SKAU_G00293520 [Synaphobranchus kaupii]|uniref:Uncharacterized protein n=1 Tax=Synaphobranchus kaupii TaxID=118154 RepID=A0A9Q1EU82_SYNKA|nr:hypothetical protein SKAU_G00293520 [Synaphobranchus kaupii]
MGGAAEDVAGGPADSPVIPTVTVAVTALARAGFGLLSPVRRSRLTLCRFLYLCKDRVQQAWVEKRVEELHEDVPEQPN